MRAMNHTKLFYESNLYDIFFLIIATFFNIIINYTGTYFCVSLGGSIHKFRVFFSVILLNKTEYIIKIVI